MQSGTKEDCGKDGREGTWWARIMDNACILGGCSEGPGNSQYQQSAGADVRGGEGRGDEEEWGSEGSEVPPTHYQFCLPVL